jgi:hypothetical protein
MTGLFALKSAPISRSIKLGECILQRRAVEAVIWGMPLVSVDTMRQAFFRDAGATYGDIAYWSKPPDWKIQFTTPSALCYYVYFNFNTKNGPVVVDLPDAAGTEFVGSIVNAWDMPLVNVCPKSNHPGTGRKYILLPPGYKAVVPSGFTPVRSETYNGYVLFRVTATPSGGNTSSALSLIRQIRHYRFSNAANPPEQKFIDMAGKLFDAVVRFDDSFFDSLARMIGEEPVRTRDLVAMTQINPLGLAKGKAFEPNQTMRDLLKQSAKEVHARLIQDAGTGEPGWPTQWIRSASVCPSVSLNYETAERFGIDKRNVDFFLAFESPQKRSDVTPHFGAFCDGRCEPLRGERNYCLNIPAAMQRWEMSAYDLNTASFIRESPRVAIHSCDNALKKNADGSVDVHFGPRSSAGEEANWIFTESGKPWFTFLRLPGAEQAFENTRALPNLEQMV